MAGTGYTLFENLKDAVPDLAALQQSKLPLTKEIKYIDRTVNTVIDQAPATMLKVGFGVVIIVLGWMLTGWLAGKMNRWLIKAHVEVTLASFLASTARFVLFFNIFIIALTFIGVSSTSIAAVLGAVGLAVGIALRNTIGSIAGGLLLIVHRPFKVGDWIEITTGNGSPQGTVKRIGMFSTEINTPDFVRVFIPNAILWENVMRNDTYNRMRMLKMDFRLHYQADVREAFEVIRGVLAAHALVLKSPEPVLGIEGFNEHAVLCMMQVWTRTEDRLPLKYGILLEVREALKAKGIRMAEIDRVAGTEATEPVSDGDEGLVKTSAEGVKSGNVGVEQTKG